MVGDPPRPSRTGRSTEQVGRFELFTELGSSALGPLWAARVASGSDEGRLVSVRRVALRGAETSVGRLTAAGILAMRMRDPKIVAVLDVAHVDRELLIASEYVDGESLRTLLRAAFAERTPIPAPIALRIAVDTLRAVRAATRHWKSFTTDADPQLASAISGGVSPDSIMIASFGDSLLGDAGIAGALARLTSLRQRPDWVCYRPPEQITPGFDPVDERSDVFSIGVMLWEMLANRPLFRGNTHSQGPAEANAVADRVLKTRVERLDQITRAGAPIPAGAVDLVAQALQRDRGARFESLDAMLDAFKALPRSVIASPEQVVAVMNQLVHSTIEARHLAIERAAGRITESQPPESGRSTFRPVAPEMGPGALPELSALAPLNLDGLEEALQQFTEHEAPTLSHGEASASKPPEGFADEARTLPREKTATPGTPPFTDESPTKPRRPPGAAFAPLNPALSTAPARPTESESESSAPPTPTPTPTPTPAPAPAFPVPPPPFATADILENVFGPDPVRSSMPLIELGAPTPLDAPADGAAAPSPATSDVPAPADGAAAPSPATSDVPIPAAGAGGASPFTTDAPLDMQPPLLAPSSDSQSGVEASLGDAAVTPRQARARKITIGVLAVVALIGIIAVIRGLTHSSKHAAETATRAAALPHASAPSTAIPTPASATALASDSIPAPKAAPPATATQAAAPPTAASAAAPAESAPKKTARPRPAGRLHWPPPRHHTFKPQGI